MQNTSLSLYLHVLWNVCNNILSSYYFWLAELPYISPVQITNNYHHIKITNNGNVLLSVNNSWHSGRSEVYSIVPNDTTLVYNLLLAIRDVITAGSNHWLERFFVHSIIMLIWFVTLINGNWYGSYSHDGTGHTGYSIHDHGHTGGSPLASMDADLTIINCLPTTNIPHQSHPPQLYSVT